MKKVFLIIVSFLCVSIIVAQEMIVRTGINYDKSKIPNVQNHEKSNDTIELPFLDDFSTTFPDVDANLWEDNFVEINYTIAYRPPSIGVVTFDALNKDQTFYTSSYATEHRADVLTSKPINLNYVDNNTIYLSFYYQAQGIADFPETKDSLVLQFQAPETEIWETVWAVEGTNENTNEPSFNKAIIQVNEEKYLKKGFRFRFYNKASLATNAKPSVVANCDHWHIDYVCLNKDRTSTDLLLKELAFQYPLKLTINDYTTIPYSHFEANKIDNELVLDCEVQYKNNDNETGKIDSINIIFKDLNNIEENDSIRLGSDNPQAGKVYLRQGSETFNYPNSGEVELRYELKTELITGVDDSTFNNVIYQNKTYGGNYAYDDGTAEGGYGLVGDGTTHSLVANKYYTYLEDTLTAVEILFNRTFKDAQPQYFYLMVWDNDPDNGKPGRLIYEKQGVYIDYQKSNTFQTFSIDSSFAVADTFYIGWKKTNSQLMNVGIDLNTVEENHKYYNLNGYWKNSSIKGELLVQPVFGKANHIGIDEVEYKIEFNIFPNPVSNYLNFEIASQNYYENFEITIYNIYGAEMYHDFHSSKGNIEVSTLQKGIYLINIVSENGIRTTKKFIKN